MRTLNLVCMAFYIILIAWGSSLSQPYASETQSAEPPVELSAASPPIPLIPSESDLLERTVESAGPPAPPRSRMGIAAHHLEIPAIHLSAPVEPVGVLANGQMGVPKKFDRVGILSPGVKPGENGNAVISGHVDHYTGPAVFYPLKRLTPGDYLWISDKSGRKLKYVVRSVESFNTPEAPLERIFGPADTPRLNLITCTGKFDKKTQEHAMRLVVFTELMDE